MAKIIPAILAKDQADFTEQFNKVKTIFTEVQIDFCTEDLVGVNSYLPKAGVINDKVIIGWHLMSNSTFSLPDFNSFKTDNIIVHFESKLKRNDLEKIVLTKIQWGLAVNPDTDIKQTFSQLDSYDFIQLMGVVPGAQGQDFNPEVIKKIVTLKNSGINKRIWIDGGVNETSVKFLNDLNIEVFVVGSYLLTGNTKKRKKILEELM